MNEIVLLSYSDDLVLSLREQKMPFFFSGFCLFLESQVADLFGNSGLEFTHHLVFPNIGLTLGKWVKSENFDHVYKSFIVCL